MKRYSASSRASALCRPERIPLTEACGRVLASDVIAGFDQPPGDVSAMDGYAVRSADARAGAELGVIGESPAGKPFTGRVEEMQAVRIFTGGMIPAGADAVVIQEDITRDGERIRVNESPRPRENIRARGLDFREGEVLIRTGKSVTPRDVAVIAATDNPQVSVTRKPRVVLFATGDELSRPGEARKQGGIVASSTYAIQAMIRDWGGEAVDGGILADRIEAFANLPRQTSGADLIVTQGGASVGDHDLVQAALGQHGFVLDFWKIAMRPGKPLIFGRMQEYSADRAAGQSRIGNGLRSALHPPGDCPDAGRQTQISGGIRQPRVGIAGERKTSGLRARTDCQSFRRVAGHAVPTAGFIDAKNLRAIRRTDHQASRRACRVRR